MAGIPNIILEVGTNYAEVRDNRTPRAIFVVRKINGVNRSLDARYVRKTGQLRPNHVRWTAELPGIGYVTDQLPLIGIARTRVHSNLFVITGHAAAQVRR